MDISVWRVYEVSVYLPQLHMFIDEGSHDLICLHKYIHPHHRTAVIKLLSVMAQLSLSIICVFLHLSDDVVLTQSFLLLKWFHAMT